jgi:hypothetical protein
MAANDSQPTDGALSDRVKSYKEEVHRIVREGLEHPRYELVRELPLQTTEQRVSFAKQMQGMANALLSTERLLVIGADQPGKTILPVTNLSELDPARVSQLLSRYLDPVPHFECFNSLETEDGKAFALIIFSSKQPKPILAKADVQAADNRFLLRKGEIWIKENTGLRVASRSDLDAMYQEDAEARARRWFDQLSNQLLSSQRFGTSSSPSIPQADLVYGDVRTFRLYIQNLIAGSHQRHFLMLMDLLRDLAIDGWHKIEAYSTRGVDDLPKFLTKINEHEKDEFLPSIRSLVELGLLLVKHSADPAWLKLVINLLNEVFDSSEKLRKLEAISVLDPEMGATVGRYLPALEALVGVRSLAMYALRREQYAALSFILKQYVRNLVPPRRSFHPFAFWPMPLGLKMPEGLNLFCWRYRIEGSWADYFGNRDEFLRSATLLEFVLEFNSWLGLSPEGKTWLEKYNQSAYFAYYPDVPNCDLNATVELAEKIYEALRRGKEDHLLLCLTVEKSLLDARLQAAPENHLLALAAFLDYLQVSQARAAIGLGRFPHRLDWGGKIGPLMQDYKTRKENGTLPPDLAFMPGLQ